MDCSLNGATGANSTVLMLIAAVVLGLGAVAVVMSRRKAPALAAVAFAFAAVGVGGAAGRADAAANSCAGLPMCIDVQNPSQPDNPDSLLTSSDGVHLTITPMVSTDGTCSGGAAPIPVQNGAIADTEAEALAICGTFSVINLHDLSVALGYITPLPYSTWWGCATVVITPGP